MRFISCVKVLGTLAILATTTTVLATPPDYIYFDNQSSVRLHATIAGLPGKPIPAQTNNYPVPYPLVHLACFQRQVMGNCPIEFTDGATGAKLASVYINAATGCVDQSPTIYGDYANQFIVTGWDAKPVSKIVIAVK